MIDLSHDHLASAIKGATTIPDSNDISPSYYHG